MTEDDRDSEVLALQIGRPLRAASKVLRRCNLHLPIVVEVVGESDFWTEVKDCMRPS